MANKLAAESSPYLLQHAQNPVHWYPWGDEAFEEAQRQNKPVIVSIGYAACHWCHVMEHESFEDEETAAFMNAHFINIKVDREEHPGVDHFYMDAVQAITGAGGWPLNVFVTPQRVPFYGGTYFPPKPLYGRASWMQVLQSMAVTWQEKPGDIAAQSDQMLNYLKQVSQATTQTGAEEWGSEEADLAAQNLLKQADTIKGGFGRAPKFPGTMAITYLLDHYHYTGHQPSLDHALHSLDAMICGGIYDQLGGGFARYATDDAWLIPHFEKMLYDNALLLVTLCDAYTLTKVQRYKEVIEETIAFVERELKDATGGYYSALDADSEGTEGKFYTWTWQEWNAPVKDDIATRYLGVVKEGNWEHTNILHVPEHAARIAAENYITEQALFDRVASVKKALLQERDERIRPMTDDKSLLSWNALMNIALSRAAVVLQNDAYLQRATEHMQWMISNFEANGKWLHTWKKGKAKIAANLDDMAYLAKAMIQLSSAGGDERYISKANALVTIAFSDFMSDDGTFFYYTSAQQKDIPVRKIEVYDGATPSANAVMAENIVLLGLCMEKPQLSGQGYDMLQAMGSSVKRYTYSFGYWACLLQRYNQKFKTLICTGDNAPLMAKELAATYLPEVLTLTSQKEISELPVLKDRFSPSVNMLFLCTQESCLPPKSTPAGILEYLHQNKK